MLARLGKWANAQLERTLKANLEDFLALELADPHGGVMVARDGSLATIVRVDGTRRMMGREEMDAVAKAATSTLHPFMLGPGHAIQVWFMRDPDMSRRMVADMVKRKRNISEAMQLSLEDLFAEQERYLPGYMVHEGFNVVLWTRPSIFSRQEMQRIEQDMKPPPLWPRATDTGDFFKASAQIRVRHSSFVSNFISEMSVAGMRMRALGSHEALQVIREGIYPEFQGAAWSPWLPGDFGERPDGSDRVPPARVGPYPQRRGDIGPLLWPRIRDYVFPLGAEVTAPTLVKVGTNLMTNIDVTIGPQQVKPFQKFLDSIIAAGEFPWRISFLIEADGLGRMQFKSILAALSSLGNPNSALIRDAIRALQARKVEGEAVVRVRTSLATWGPSSDPRLVEERGVRLLKLVETWGLQTATQSVGDPLEGVLSSAVGLSVSSTAPAGAEPLLDVAYRLPWMRDASPYSEGSVLFRTFDGRMWPYQPGSTEHQDTAIDFVYAPPGKGKSVWLNTTNLGFCLNARAAAGTGGAQLPRVSIIDIGMSSSGVISLLQSALPESARHQVLYRRLRMDKEDSINPFDTQLGYRKPLPTEFSFLVNFLSLVGTEPGKSAPPDGLTDLCRMVVEEVYERYSDQARTGTPKEYTPDVEPEVDEAIVRAGIELPPKTSWWWVTDALFRAYPGEEGVRLASMAQRNAVPVLEDLSPIAGSEKVRDIFGDTQVQGSGETLIKMFDRLIASAIRAYPILVHPTRLDFGGARVISLDLNDAAPGAGSPNDNKQTAIVYMLARFVLARDFYIYPEHVLGAPELYREYQSKRVTRLRETPKRLVFDEFHRTKAAQSVREQVVVDMREGRKHGVQIALASQMLQDFDSEMLALGSGFWVMGCANEKEKEETAKTFGLSETARLALDDLTGARPDGGGSPFLVVLNMRDGTHEHLLLNTLGPVELWAFTTNPDDANLRNRLYALVGPSEARKRLAARFPKGTAGKEIASRKAAMERGGTRMTPEAEKGVIAAIAQEMAAAAG